MDISDEDRFSSKPYTFVVQGKPFYVHAACISACSAPLGRMMSGHMAEAQQGFALLEDVTQGTFTRFIRWTYSKDYESPAPKITTFSASEDGRLDRPVADDSILDDGIVVLEPTKKKVKKKKKDIYEVINLKETFMASTHDDLPSNPGKTPAARPNKSPEEDYADVFRSHAEVYVFAEKYDIQPLKTLALRKLQQILAIFTLFTDRVGDILSLLRYVYAETALSKAGEEDIRTMLMHYVVIEVGTLKKHSDFKELLAEDSDMLGDFLSMLAKWIGSTPGFSDTPGRLNFR